MLDERDQEMMKDLDVYSITMKVWTGGKFVEFTTEMEAVSAQNAKRQAKEFHSEALVIDCNKLNKS